MSKVFINESTLTAIGDAIRGKTGGTELIAPLNMANEIEGITTGDVGLNDFIPESAFTISGTCTYMFANNHWNWFIENYGDKITTNNITSSDNMFRDCKNLTSIPFDLNLTNTSYTSFQQMFYYCNNLKEVGNLVNIYPSTMNYMFASCLNLRYLPEFINPNFSRIQTYAYSSMGSMFDSCYSLRKIPEDLLNQLWGIMISSSYPVFNNAFQFCHCLDEIIGLNPQTGTITSNMLGSTFKCCGRVKDIIFALQEDGIPYSVNWKTQTIDLTTNVGYVNGRSYVLNYNSGITADKEVTDDATYQALKDDVDWWSAASAYSRYNHDSAVNTINSLPDTSAYLATAGGTNTIKFKGTSGSSTDGGAINTLTAEEIAVATAKGWTVSLV
jgi:hypothetical protein